jgi:hypothetical protein
VAAVVVVAADDNDVVMVVLLVVVFVAVDDILYDKADDDIDDVVDNVLAVCNSGFCNRMTRSVGTADTIIISVAGEEERFWWVVLVYGDGGW